jgi:hypothetical protein
VSGVLISAIKKFQITNHKYQMVRQAHHHTTLSQVEGQITKTEIDGDKLQVSQRFRACQMLQTRNMQFSP